MIGRLLMEARDRLDPAFGAPPLEQAVDIARQVAWDVYLVYKPGVKWEGPRPPRPTFWMHQLEGVDAMAKHIIVMSDGLSQPGDFAGILKATSEQGISVSTVAIGEGADGTRLEEIARSGKGAFHATQDFKALPSIPRVHM